MILHPSKDAAAIAAMAMALTTLTSLVHAPSSAEAFQLGAASQYFSTMVEPPRTNFHNFNNGSYGNNDNNDFRQFRQTAPEMRQPQTMPNTLPNTLPNTPMTKTLEHPTLLSQWNLPNIPQHMQDILKNVPKKIVNFPPPPKILKPPKFQQFQQFKRFQPHPPPNPPKPLKPPPPPPLPPTDDPLLLLGFNSNSNTPTNHKTPNIPSSFQDIRRAYKSLAKLYHPDAVVGPDSTPEERDAASKEFARINAAYARLKSMEARGTLDQLLKYENANDNANESMENGWVDPSRASRASRVRPFTATSASSAAYHPHHDNHNDPFRINYDRIREMNHYRKSNPRKKMWYEESHEERLENAENHERMENVGNERTTPQRSERYAQFPPKTAEELRRTAANNNSSHNGSNRNNHSPWQGWQGPPKMWHEQPYEERYEATFAFHPTDHCGGEAREVTIGGDKRTWMEEPYQENEVTPFKTSYKVEANDGREKMVWYPPNMGGETPWEETQETKVWYEEPYEERYQATFGYSPTNAMGAVGEAKSAKWGGEKRTWMEDCYHEHQGVNGVGSVGSVGSVDYGGRNIGRKGGGGKKQWWYEELDDTGSTYEGGLRP